MASGESADWNRASTFGSMQAEAGAAEPPVLAKRPVSARQLEANRRNALRSTGPRTAAGKARSALNGLKSTGPRTPAGKARSKRNAIRHGLWAADPILHEETPAFRDFLIRFIKDHGLQTEYEWRWGRAMARTCWMLHKVEALQNAIFGQDVPAWRVLEAMNKYQDAENRLRARFFALVRWWSKYEALCVEAAKPSTVQTAARNAAAVLAAAGERTSTVAAAMGMTSAQRTEAIPMHPPTDLHGVNVGQRVERTKANVF